MLDKENMSMADAEKLAETGILPEGIENQGSGFAELGLSEKIIKAIELKGYKKPSPIQAGVIPLLLNGDKDIIGQAQTGTGKTAAFSLPLLERLDVSVTKTQAIVLAPTRELAIQVANEMKSFAVENSPTIQTIYGGNSIRDEVAGLRRNPTIIVGTPGRVQHHIRTKVLKLDHIKYFVLDEADEMLNFGFRSEIESILEKVPEDRKILMFSATMPKAIKELATKFMGDYDSVKIAAKEMTNENITQKYYCLNSSDKLEALCRIMEMESTFYSIIFCRTKREVDGLTAKLKLKHFDVEAIHGDVDQKARERILHRFKTGYTKLLVATDVAARGIDVSALNFVVNYTIPESYETYTHRIGRTGRAGNKGTALTFVTRSELQKLRYFERQLRVSMEQGILPEISDVIARKQQHLVEKVEHLINNEDLDNVMPMAAKLLEEGDAQKIIAALLKTTYSNEFSASSYSEISPEKPRSFSDRSSSSGHRRRSGSSNRGSGSYARKDSDGSRKKGFGSQNKSRGGKVGGGSAKRFGTKFKKRGIGKPKGPDQYPGSKKSN